MSRGALKIYFVTWPDGKLCEGTQTSVGEDMALARLVRTWLNPTFFLYHIWPAMERAGFKIQSLEVPKDIAEGLSQ